MSCGGEDLRQFFKNAGRNAICTSKDASLNLLQQLVNPDNTLEIFHFSPKRVRCLKGIQHLLDLLELKINKPSDTHGISHEQYIKAIEENYSTTITALSH